MQAVLCEGDQFVDGGANIGLLSLLAASIVGPEGKVIAFEPNPEVHSRVKEHADMNGLAQIELHKCGLSDEAAELTFRVIDGGSESGTLAALADKQMKAVTSEMVVSVRRGDDLLLGTLSPQRRSFIKLDVEGFETQAVKGLMGVIDKCRPVLTTEYQKHLTKREDLDALFSLLGARGYAAFSIGLRRNGIFSHRLKLDPLPRAADLADRTDKSDVVWLLPEARGYFEEVLSGA
jgi:FkbM family methyltransferase